MPQLRPGTNRSPAKVGCMRQALGPGALGRPRGTWWRGRREGGSGWGIHVNPWLIHFNVWNVQNPLQYCKVISLQLIKKNLKKKLNMQTHTHTKSVNRNSEATRAQKFEVKDLWVMKSASRFCLYFEEEKTLIYRGIDVDRNSFLQ